MKKFKILIPIYNDWKSVFKLLEIIDTKISNQKHHFSVILIDDASTEPMEDTKINYKNIKSVNIIRMKKNQGHTRSNATGIKYLSNKKDFDYLIVMDGDGEDRPEELNLLIEKAINSNTSTVAKRIKRSEGLLFTFLYNIHKFITFIFTGKNMNFGHYCCLTKNDVLLLSTKGSLWCNFSSSVKKYIKKLEDIPCIRGVRYVQPSKMSFTNLIIHSFSIIAVFRYQVLLRVIIISLLTLFFLEKFYFFVVSLQISLFLFLVVILVTAKRENKKALDNSTKEVKEIVNIYTT